MASTMYLKDLYLKTKNILLLISEGMVQNLRGLYNSKLFHLWKELEISALWEEGRDGGSQWFSLKCWPWLLLLVLFLRDRGRGTFWHIKIHKSQLGNSEKNQTHLSHTRIKVAAAAAAKSLQSCPTLCDPVDGSPPGPPTPGILQARTLEWAAISFSNAWKWKVKVKLLSRIWLFVTPWTAAHQAPASMGFSRQEYWSGVPLSSPSIKVENTAIDNIWDPFSAHLPFPLYLEVTTVLFEIFVNIVFH